MKIGIACAAGTFKGVFVHGVLESLNSANFVADIYAAASSACIPAAYAAVGNLAPMGGPDEWIKMYDFNEKNGRDVSKTIITSIHCHRDFLETNLFSEKTKRFGVAVSAVNTPEAAELTQGSGARRLGKQLLLATRKRDRSWADSNLTTKIFQSGFPASEFPITADNLTDVLYATTRMLHAWKTPASIDGLPCIDASYTCNCPAIELADMGCEEVIAITPEEGKLYRDFFQSCEIPDTYKGAKIHVIKPDINLANLGVDYMKATTKGFNSAFELGLKAGQHFIESWQKRLCHSTSISCWK
jgi:hypothetical protein